MKDGRTEICGIGVVSLLAMLEFYAKEYLALSFEIGVALGNTRHRTMDSEAIPRQLEKLLRDATRLGLVVTRQHINEMILEFVSANKGKISYREGKVQFDASVEVDPARFAHHLEVLYSSVKAELGTMLFRAVPRERNPYIDSDWLKLTPIESKFPTSFQELSHAGSCYALGEPVASVFHSMRALEPALASLATHFGISASGENWNTVIERIESSVRDLGKQPKSNQKIADETFFGSSASHLYFVKNAWRNHVAHARGAYSDIESLRVLSHTVEFIESICPRLQE